MLLDFGVVSEAALDPAEPCERTDSLEPPEDTREDVAMLLLLPIFGGDDAALKNFDASSSSLFCEGPTVVQSIS